MPRATDVIDPIDRFVGERLRAARLQRGLTQAELGAAMKVSFQQVQKYERGTNRVSASMLFRAGQALGVPMAAFFPADDPDQQVNERIGLRATRGGAPLAEYFMAMDPAHRAVLLQVAQAFARGSK